MMRSFGLSAMFVVLTLGCASTTTSRPTPSVSDIYFTNAETGPGYQEYQGGNVYQIAPPIKVFDRGRDNKIEAIVVLTDGSTHEIYLTLTTPGGGRYPYTWAVPSLTRFSTWRAEGWRWPLSADWPAGQYEVEFIVDGVSAGTYAFEVK